ncbi:hypothetical protein EHQ61_08725 [Leptospira wolffii]|nr:hypothetical protein EHQ61_08725 [Leptospira wolffii]
MIRNLIRDLSLAIPALPIVIQGWKKFLSQLIGRFSEFFSEKSGKEKLLFILALAQLFFSLSAWVDYSIDLGTETSGGFFSKLGALFGNEPVRSTVENVSVRVGSNIFFILPSFLVFFFGGFWRSSWVPKTLLFLQIFSGILLAAGLLLPDLFFVSFVREEDYTYNFNFYAFGIVWLLTTAISAGSQKQ